MAAQKIVFDYEAMQKTVTALNGFAQEYKQNGSALITSLNDATASWEGESKNKFVTLEESVKKFVENDVPSMITGLAELLENNAKNMSDADTEIANSIPDSIS